VKGDGTHDREEGGIAGHLQAELHGFLAGDGQQGGHGPGAQPPRDRPALFSHGVPNVPDEDAEAHERGQREQEPAFCRELDVVVVGLRKEVRQLVRW
jgi:hypothetical protein